jgi:hypothetical protein
LAGSKCVYRLHASFDDLIGALQHRLRPTLVKTTGIVAVAFLGIMDEFEIGQPMRRLEDNRRTLQDELAAR